MKHLRYLLMAALVAMPLTACDEDDDTPQDIVDPTPVGTVSGTVSVEGNGLAGVSVTLVGSTSQSATTGSGGSFTFSNVEAGSYGVSISDVPSDVSFSTTSKTTSITTDGQTVTVDFSGSYIRTSTIAGQVVVAGAGLAGIAVTATGPEGAKNAVTDNGGNYSFSGLRAGDYTIAISGVPATYTFATTSYEVTLGTGEAKTASFFGNEVQTVDPVTASVVIKSVTTGATNVPVVPSNVAGQIDVTLQIDPGENELTKIALLLNGTEVASQNLSQAVFAEDMQKADGIFEVVFSVNTAEFDGTTFMPKYMNGQYELAAQLGLDNAQQASVNTSIGLTFNNLDTFRATAVPTKSMIGGTTASNPGALYYGGGPIVVDVNPIVYSGRTIASVTTGFTNTGAGALPGTDTAAPFAITYNLTGYASAAAAGTGNEAFTVVAATYTDGTAFGPANGGAFLPINVTNGVNLFVDNAAPPTGTLTLTDQVTADELCCSNNWVRSAYAVSDGYTGAGDNAAGVFIGGVTTEYFAGAAGSTLATLTAGTPITTIGDAGLAATLVSTTYTMANQEADAFGNANGGAFMVASADNPATTFGIDDTAPATQTYTGTRTDYRILNTAVAGAGENYNFGVTEDKSGFSSDFVRANESLFNTAGTSYPNFGTVTGGMLNYPPPLAAPDNTFTEGYYTWEGYAINQAGGAFSPSVVRHTLVDVTAPVAQNVQIPGSLVGGAMTTFTAPVSDNLDLLWADFDFEFSTPITDVYPAAPTTAFWPFGDPADPARFLGTAWDDVLTTSATAARTIPLVTSIEDNALTTIFGASFVRIGAVDAAGNESAAQVNNFASATVSPAPSAVVSYALGPDGLAASGDELATFAINSITGDGTSTNLCNTQGTTACVAADNETLTVEVVATGPAGTFPPPFVGGYIYMYLWDEGVDAAANTPDDDIHLVSWIPGNSGVVTDTGATRTYTYTFTITAADAATYANGTTINIIAIGVNGDGAGLLSTVDATYTIVDGN